MITIWVLVAIYYNGTMSRSLEFLSQERCETAKRELLKNVSVYEAIHWKCVEK